MEELKVDEEEIIKEESLEKSPEEVKKTTKFSQRKRRKRIPMKIIAKMNYFFRNKIDYIDYKDTKTLQQFINKQGQIIPKKFNRLPTKYQRLVAKAIKRARQMALMPYIIVEQTLKEN